MELAALLALVVGGLMPPAVEAVTAAWWPSWVKLAVALVVSLLLGTLTAWAAGALDTAEGWGAIVGTVFAASQVAYRTWWHRPSVADREPDPFER